MLKDYHRVDAVQRTFGATLSSVCLTEYVLGDWWSIW